MLNKFGICESAMRRSEHIDKCPHSKMRGIKTMSEQQKIYLLILQVMQ